MRKFKLFLTLLTLVIFGCGQMWGATYTIGWGTATGSAGTYTNFTATSGSVTNVLSFSSNKGSSSTTPAYNSSSNELRLYYHSGGSGGYITLTPESGVTITGFVMTTSTTPSVKYSVNGGTATSVSASNNTYTVTGISASSSLKIQNVNTTNTQLRIKTIQITYTTSGGGSQKQDLTDAQFGWSAASATVTKDGNNNVFPTLYNTLSKSKTFQSTDETVATIAANGTISLLKAGTTTIKAIFAGDVTYNAKTVSYTLTVNKPAPTPIAGGIVDELVISTFGVTGGYTAFTNKQATNTEHSSAVYAGTVARNGNSTKYNIQLNSGQTSSKLREIATSTSGGYAKRVYVTWATQTANTAGRKLTVYGRNTAYTGSETASAGTKIDDIAYVANATTDYLDITSDYKYIQIVADNAIYMDEIDITWVPISSAVTITSPTNGTIAVKKKSDESSVSSGSSIAAGTVLKVSIGDVTGYRFTNLRAYKTGDQSTTVTISNGELTMPDYPITITATETALFAVSLAVAAQDENGDPLQGAQGNSATIDGGTVTVYKANSETAALVANKASDYDFVGWSASTGSITFTNSTATSTTATIGAAGTITATFKKKGCVKLGTPVVSVTNKTYNGAKLTWSGISNADKYKVYIYNSNKSEEIEHNDAFTGTEYTIGETLTGATTYTYVVTALSNTPASYCESNAAEATFTTENNPSVTLYYSENGNVSAGVSQQILSNFTLPTSVTHTCTKDFVGWTTETYKNYSGNAAPTVFYAPGATYQIPTNANCTIYAVYATDNQDGAVTWTRVTALNTLTSGGTFIMGYEADHDAAGVIVPMRNNDVDGASTSADGFVRSGTTASSSTSGTITMSSLGENGGDAYEVTVEAGTVDGTIAIKLASNKYVGKPSSGNKIRLYTAKGVQTNMTPELKTSDVIQLKFSSDSSFQYNATSNQERFARYKNTQQNVVFYKKGVGASTYSAYATTCAASPTATVDPEEIEATYEAVEDGAIEVEYAHVKASGVTVGLFNDEACTEAFAGSWLTASLDGSKNITYTIAANNSYNDARSAYIKLTAPETNEATDPAVVVIPVTQAKKPAIFSSLQDLVAADVNANTDVTVSFSNVPIKEIYMYNSNRRGLVFNIQKDAADIKIYFNADVPAAWVAGGKVSGTLTVCPWKTYDNAWQLAPKSGWAWTSEEPGVGLSYTAPPVIESVEIRGTETHTAYIDGQVFDPAGLEVIAIYDNDDEEDVTEYTSWTYSPATLSTSDNKVTATATYNNKSDSKTIDVTVSPIPEKTVEEFIEAGGTRCYLEGIVSNIENTQQGTPKVAGYFDLTDAEENTIHIYGCLNASGVANKFNELGVANGDKIKVIAETYEYYQSSTHEAKNVQYVSHISPVAITIEDQELAIGSTWTIEINTDPDGADADVTYSIKNDGSSAYVSLSNDVVTGVAAGTATLIASIPDGDDYLANSVEFTVTVQFHGTITYVENGGSTVADVADATALPSTLPTPTKEHCTFDGWWTTSNFADGTEAVPGATLTANATLYAKWIELPKWSYTYDSNVDLVGGGTSKEVAKVKVYGDALQTEYDAVKAGSGNNTGTVSVTLPIGTTALHFHAAAWAGKSCTIQIENLKTPNPTFELTADAGMKNSTPYTLEGDMTGDQYYSVTFNALEEATTVTFSKSGDGDNRFIIYGVNAIYPQITLNPATYDFENVRANQTKQQVFTITPNENVSGALSASITNDASGKFSVGSISAGKVTVTFDPNGAEEGTFTAKLLVETSNASVTANLSGTAIAALAPEITVDKNAVAFGRVNPNAEVSEAIAVELLHIDGAASAALSGDDVAKFSLSTNSLSENGNIVITPVTTENGIFSATLTLSATGADDVEIPLSITVANKWAVMYTSNVTLTTTGGTSANTAKVKVNGEATQYDAIKAGTGSVYGAVVVTVPAKTQALHLHAAAWKGETVTLNITGASPSSLALTADDGMNSNSPFTLSNSPIGQAFDLTVPYSETATAITFTADNSTNQSGKRFVIYGVNEEGGIHELPAGNVDETAIPDEVNMVVGEDQTWTVNNDKTVGDLYMKDGAIIANNAKVEANDLYFKAKAGKSNQIYDLSKITVEGSLYYDFQLCDDDLDADYWYSISVPFDVNLNSGVFQTDGTPMVNRSDFEVWEYDPQKRADTQYNGWKRTSDNMMHAGKAYLIGFNPGQPNVIRLKAAAGWKTNLFSGTSMSVVNTGGSGDHDNWNGLANPTGRYIDVNVDAQAFNNNTHGWDSYALDAARFNFVVGTAFFVQSASAITIGNTDHGNYRAPKREGANESKCAYAVRITRNEATSFDNQIIVRASEDATSEYEQGHDMLTMNDATSKKAALLWTKNYGGKRLAIEEAPFVGDKASYELGIYAPANGTYFISVAEAKDNADLYLTYEGSIIWNLSAGAYEVELGKGATNEYGLMMVRKAPQVTTGVETIDNSQFTIHNCQKVILNDHVYILREGQLYDVTGKAVK